MAALTNVRDTSELGGKYIALPVKGATTIYQGAIVAVDANGYAIPGKKAADLKAAGRAEETVENKGGDGDAVIRVSRGTFVFENSTSGKITAADVLRPGPGWVPASCCTGEQMHRLCQDRRRPCGKIAAEEAGDVGGMDAFGRSSGKMPDSRWKMWKEISAFSRGLTVAKQRRL